MLGTTSNSAKPKEKPSRQHLYVLRAVCNALVPRLNANEGKTNAMGIRVRRCNANARKARRATYSPTHVISAKPADCSTPDASGAACLDGRKSVWKEKEIESRDAWVHSVTRRFLQVVVEKRTMWKK